LPPAAAGCGTATSIVCVGCCFGTVERNTSAPMTSTRTTIRTANLGMEGAFADRGARCIALRVIDLTKRLDRPVVLVGLMGVGKSTVGRRLARRLGLSFVDSDAAIEDAAGFSAAEVFERYGESDFRDGERRLVARLIEGSVRVIATGGGAYVDPRTRQLLNERAITVWLDAPIDILAERTSHRDTRAQLRNGDPKATLERLATERRASYEQAHIHVKSGDGAHKDVVDSIVSALESFLAASSPGPEIDPPRPGATGPG
jgi:shikimate kinase